MAVYKGQELEEQSIYGSSRLGLINYASQTAYRSLGGKKYELSNHLGNVLAVVSDNIHLDQDSTWTSLINTTDYYPFGLAMDGRSVQDSAYRYGFNTQEKVDEIKGPGNHYTAEFWEYDPRVVHRWNLDPRPNPSISSYAIMRGSPIWYSDPLGDTIVVNNTGYISRNDETDNLVFTRHGEELTQIGELGKSVDVNSIYQNLLSQNTETAEKMFNPIRFYNLVKTRGDWDLKADDRNIFGLANIMSNKGEIPQTQFLFQNESMEAQDVGNHHFGVVSLAYGLFPSEDFILKQAGLYQIKSGTSKPEWQIYETRKVPIFNKSGQSGWGEQTLMLPPYGDDPRDQKWIISGFDYYKMNKK